MSDLETMPASSPNMLKTFTGFCTPTILAIILSSIFIIFAFLAVHRTIKKIDADVTTPPVDDNLIKQSKRQLYQSLIGSSVMSVVLIIIMYLLCKNNRTGTSWAIFVIFWVLPTVIVSALLFSVMRKFETKKVETYYPYSSSYHLINE